MGNGSRVQSLKFVRRVAFARRPKPSNWPMSTEDPWKNRRPE